MTIDTRAVEACRRYVEAQDIVKCLTRRIGETLLHCPLSRDPETVPTAYDQDDIVLTSHLKRAFNQRYPQSYLSERCPHCLAAYDLIQQRKQARQAFGRAKAAITRIGRGGR